MEHLQEEEPFSSDPYFRVHNIHFLFFCLKLALQHFTRCYIQLSEAVKTLKLADKKNITSIIMLYSRVTEKLVNVLSFSIKYSKNCNLQGQSVGMCHSNLNFYIVLVCTAKIICQRKNIKARTSTFVLYDSTIERED